MYLMLRGILPFDSHEVDTILKNTIKADVPLDDDHWSRISPEGKDLLMKFLEKDSNKRIDINDALKHPWIRKRDELLPKYRGVNRIKSSENNSRVE
mmetsp:Transcript_6087/g.5434  ORF Transcript_6087/g.5434 Transcript_6087/m.5434 type:complete len:96 (+) Transcript_6087:1368-1655(+)